VQEVSLGRIRLSVEEARSLSRRALGKLGYDEAQAEIITDHVVDAALCGYEYSGLAKILNIAENSHFKAPRKPPEIVHETPVSALLDGGNNVGMVALHHATEVAIRMAGASGIAVIGVTNSWMSGRLAYYAERMARAGLIGLQLEATGTNSVAPPGGLRGSLGTNPICFGLPTGRGPVVFDMGTSAIMGTDVALRVRTGQPLPAGVAIDPAGQPTRDPRQAKAGALLTFGGYKGFGLSMIVQMFGVLAGCSFPVEQPHGAVIIAFKPDLLAPADRFKEQADGLIAHIKATPRQPGIEEIRLPSEHAFKSRERLSREGIELDRTVFDALSSL